MLKAAPLRLWALFGAAPVLTVAGTALSYIVWKGGWPDRLAEKQLDYLGYTLLACMFLIGVIVITLAAVKVKGSGPGGLGFEVDPEDSKP